MEEHPMELRRRPRVSGDRSVPPERERPAASDSGSVSRPPKLTFSFDSAGWLYCYHLGAAQVLRAGSSHVKSGALIA